MAPFPPLPVNTIDWSNVGFRVREVNGHVESRFSTQTNSWTALKWVADPYMRVHGMAPVLNYGVQAFEGLKAFRAPGDGQINVFRPDRNAARLQRSADFLAMPPVPESLFLDAVRGAVALNAEFVPPHETGAAMYVRPQLYGSSAQLGLSPPDEYTFCVFVLPTGVYHGSHPVRALILDDFDRAAPKGTGSAKVGGNYAPVLRWSERARNEGYGITLHLDSKTHVEVDEFSTSGFIGALVQGDQVTLVVPDSESVIDSVTSSSVLEIGEGFGWKVDRRSIKYSELPEFSEVMAAGTAAALVPIRSITRRIAPDSPAALSTLLAGHPKLTSTAKDPASGLAEETVTLMPDSQEDAGPLCDRLLTQLKAIQLGKVKDERHWLFPVAEQDGLKIEGAPTTSQNGANGTGNAGQSVDQLE